MAVSNNQIAKLEGQIAEVAGRRRQVKSEIVDLRATLENLREADVTKAVERAGKLTAEIMGREIAIKTLAEVEAEYRTELEAEQREERERRRVQLTREIESRFVELEKLVMAAHSYAKSPDFAKIITGLTEADTQWSGMEADNRLGMFTSELEKLLLPRYAERRGEWVRRT